MNRPVYDQATRWLPPDSGTVRVSNIGLSDFIFYYGHASDEAMAVRGTVLGAKTH